MIRHYSLPNNWSWKRLEEVCEKITDGSHYSPPTEQNGFAYLTVRDINNDGDFDFENCKKISESNFLDLVKNGCKPKLGDVLFSKDGTVGKVALVDFEKDFVVLSSLGIIRPNPNKIDSKFLFWLLRSPLIQSFATDSMAGAAIKRIVVKTLKNFPIPLPPPDTQRRIVAKLDAAFAHLDEAIRLQQENLARTADLKMSLLEEVFSNINGKYEVKKLSMFDHIVAGGTPSRQIDDYWNGDVDWFTSGELNTHTIRHSKEKISKKGLENSNAKLFEPGTLLVGMYDTAALKMSILEKPASCNQAVVGIKPDENILNVVFLKYQLEYLRPTILLQRQGVRQQNLNAKKIRDIEIVYPKDISIQYSIVTQIDNAFAKIDSLNREQQSRLHHLEQFKKSILEEAFQGKL